MSNRYHIGGRTKIVHPWTPERLRELLAFGPLVRRVGDVLITDLDPTTATHRIVVAGEIIRLQRLRNMRTLDPVQPAKRRTHPSGIKGVNPGTLGDRLI